MTAPDWAPDRGDLIWLDFNPILGHEQGGRRPAVVLSRQRYNRLTGLAVCCPVTSRVKGYVMEYLLPADAPAHGAVLTDQIRSLGWRERNAELIGRLDPTSLETVLDMAREMLA